MEDRNIEKSLLILLFFITVVQFSTWGYQSVIYILSVMFGVDTNLTPLSSLIGLIAMVASAFLFIGSFLWWKEKTSAWGFIKIGAIIFIVKNVFDLINEIWIFSNTYNEYTQALISKLATMLGGQFFQLAFWIFVLFYLRYKIQERMYQPAEPAQPVQPAQTAQEQSYVPQQPMQ